MTQTTQKEKTLLSPRIPRDTEHERYHPELEEELKECPVLPASERDDVRP